MGHINIQPPLFAHRGASAYAPENTMSAFVKAAQMGAKWIECDVMLTADEYPVIIHDETLERTTNGQGDVCHHSLAQIKNLDAGSWFDSIYTNERIPELSQLLDFLNDVNLCVNIELKPIQYHEEILVHRVIHVMQYFLQAHPDRVIFSSFSVEALDYLRKYAPSSRIALLMHEVLPDWRVIAKRLNCVSVNVNCDVLTPELIHDIKNSGYNVCCYTVDDIDVAAKLYRSGVDALFTNAPDRIIALQKQLLDDANSRYKLK